MSLRDDLGGGVISWIADQSAADSASGTDRSILAQVVADGMYTSTRSLARVRPVARWNHVRLARLGPYIISAHCNYQFQAASRRSARSLGLLDRTRQPFWSRRYWTVCSVRWPLARPALAQQCMNEYGVEHLSLNFRFSIVEWRWIRPGARPKSLTTDSPILPLFHEAICRQC